MTNSNDAAVKAAAKVSSLRDATKDAGRVHIGGGMMHFSDAATARDATKDTGRVHVGGGMMRF